MTQDNITVKAVDMSDPAMDVYARLTEAQLRNPREGRAVFIAESPKVIMTALSAGYQPESLLCERRHIEGDACEIIASQPGLTVYTGEREQLASLTGYTLTRGVLCAMRRPEERPLAEVLDGARRVVVLDGVCDTTNIGAIFRSAAALGIDAVLLTRQTCDPLNRRAIRVSMGSVFLVPWTWIDSVSDVQAMGFKTVAMALRHDSLRLDSPVLCEEPRLAMVMGTEGDGLADDTILSADYVVKIPMAHGVDSLNVACAASIAFWELCKE